MAVLDVFISQYHLQILNKNPIKMKIYEKGKVLLRNLLERHYNIIKIFIYCTISEVKYSIVFYFFFMYAYYFYYYD